MLFTGVVFKIATSNRLHSLALPSSLPWLHRREMTIDSKSTVISSIRIVVHILNNLLQVYIQREMLALKEPILTFVITPFFIFSTYCIHSFYLHFLMGKYLINLPESLVIKHHYSLSHLFVRLNIEFSKKRTQVQHQRNRTSVSLTYLFSSSLK